ncbi:MAG: hypothetical protein A3H96_21640 [Acidobacteria bacterium RIFCSPLOWO2_02_FULL_67_36]|nr:MAG: hypothetical protein A3H96_21640 [Acidobacteria bacterium RIFCSPLOWO2_02_FULL_67_36]
MRSVDVDSRAIPAAEEVRAAFERAVRFLLSRQLESGELPMHVSGDRLMRVSRRDPTPFATTFAIEAFRVADTGDVAGAIRNAQNFLLGEMEPGARWRYWRVRPDRAIPADADDTACASVALRGSGTETAGVLAANRETLLRHRDPAGRFYTWFGVAPPRNDVDSVVNANVARYLGDGPATQGAIDFVIDLLEHGREENSHRYYVDDLALYHAVARAGATVGRFEQASRLLASRILARLERGDVAGSDLLTALALSALLRVDGVSSEQPRRALVERLLERQGADGGWACEAFYAGPPPPGPLTVWFGSRELTTALGVEALGLFVRRPAHPFTARGSPV